ncbi:hypothetical protein YC2023_006957 [Brassica napus]
MFIRPCFLTTNTNHIDSPYHPNNYSSANLFIYSISSAISITSLCSRCVRRGLLSGHLLGGLLLSSGSPGSSPVVSLAVTVQSPLCSSTSMLLSDLKWKLCQIHLSISTQTFSTFVIWKSFAKNVANKQRTIRWPCCCYWRRPLLSRIRCKLATNWRGLAFSVDTEATAFIRCRLSLFKARPKPLRTKTREQTRVYSERKKKTRVEHQDIASMLPPIRVLHRSSASTAPQQTPETYRDQNHHQRTINEPSVSNHPFISVFQALKSINRLSRSHSTPFATNTKRRSFSQIRNINQQRASNRPAMRSFLLHHTTKSIKQNHHIKSRRRKVQSLHTPGSSVGDDGAVETSMSRSQTWENPTVPLPPRKTYKSEK